MIPLKDENPRTSFPYVTVGLIVLNIFVFLYQFFTGQRGQMFTYKFALIPYDVFHEPDLRVYFTFVSSMFLHGSLWHLLGNMLFLWVFGDNIEDVLGKIKYVIFYVVCGVLAGLIHALAFSNSQTMTLGASGAISGILGAYMLLFPRVKVLTLIPIFFIIRFIWLPASFFLGIWFIYQLLYAVSPSSHGIAFLAHIGGFLTGLVLIGIFTGIDIKTKLREIWR